MASAALFGLIVSCELAANSTTATVIKAAVERAREHIRQVGAELDEMERIISEREEAEG